MLSIVVPAHNEEDNIGSLIDKIMSFGLDVDFELVIIVDHCSDATYKIAVDKSHEFNNLKIVENNLAAGFANALKTGFLNSGGDLVVPVMGDLCDDLGTIRKMYEKAVQGYDIVCGSRYIRGGLRLGGSRLKGFFSFFVGWSLYYLLGVPTHDISNAFKMYRKKVLDSTNIEASWFEVSMEIPLKAYYAGFSITEVPTVWREREKGKSSFNMFKLFRNYLKFYLWGISQRLNFKTKRQK
jgi:dolichol-phosphate mannosyltransferase